MTQATRKAAVPLLKRLVELDQQTSRAYYEMGQLMSAIKRDKLHEQLQYGSFTQLVEEELSFSITTAKKYIVLYQNFQTLKYKKQEAFALLYEFGFSNMSRYLEEATTKVGVRTIRKRIQEMVDDRFQLNFILNGKDHRLVESVLIDYGAEKHEGRLMNSKVAFMNIVKTARKGKAQLRVVA